MQGVRRAETQLGEVACVIGLGLIGQLVVRVLIAGGVKVDRDRHGRGSVPDGREGWGPGLCRPGSRWHRARRDGCPEPQRGSGLRPCVPRSRRHLQPACRGGGPAGPRSRPGRGHRQDQARPPLERLLREGARRPLLAVLRAGSLRRPLRARRHRLPRRLRPLDRAAQPGLFSRADRRRPARRLLARLGHPPDRRGHPGLCASRRWIPRRGRAPASLPRRRSGHRREGAPRGPGQHDAPPAIARAGRGRRPRLVRVGFIGAGSYATSMLLPHLAAHDRVELAAVATTRSLSAVNAQRKFGFEQGGHATPTTSSRTRALDAVFVVTVIAPTRRSSAGHSRPARPCSSRSRWLSTRRRSRRFSARSSAPATTGIMVGFNRRFAPLVTELAGRLERGQGPLAFRYLVNAGSLAAGSWYLDAAEGTRFVGEGGHFVDTLSALVGADPLEVHARVHGEDVQCHAGLSGRLDRVDHLCDRRQCPLPEGNPGRLRGRSQRPAGRLHANERLGPRPQGHPERPCPRQGPAPAGRSVRRRRGAAPARCRSASTRSSRRLAPRSARPKAQLPGDRCRCEP